MIHAPLQPRPGAATDSMIDAGDLRERVKEGLSVPEKQVLVMRYLERLTVAEIAAAMEMPEDKVVGLLRRLVGRVRLAAARNGTSCPLHERAMSN